MGERVVDRSHYILETVKGERLALIFENNQRKKLTYLFLSRINVEDVP